MVWWNNHGVMSRDVKLPMWQSHHGFIADNMTHSAKTCIPTCGSTYEVESATQLTKVTHQSCRCGTQELYEVWWGEKSSNTFPHQNSDWQLPQTLWQRLLSDGLKTLCSLSWFLILDQVWVPKSIYRLDDSFGKKQVCLDAFLNADPFSYWIIEKDPILYASFTYVYNFIATKCWKPFQGVEQHFREAT